MEKLYQGLCIIFSVWSAIARNMGIALQRIKGSMGIIHTIVTTCSDTSNRWFAQRYNANNAWIFNGTNGNLNNNNVNNGNSVQAVTNLSKVIFMLP